MKVQLWCDMEGIAGIVKWDQVNYGTPLYEEGRRLYTEEINAAVRGAKRAGATEIIVVDGHGAGGACSMNSLVKDLLEPGAEYVFGYRWGCYVEELQNGCDAMLLPGAHARVGNPLGGMSHTMSSATWVECTLNGQAVGESGIVAAIAGTFGVPVVFVSGDDVTCREVADFVGASVVQAPVKKAIGRFASRCMAPQDARALIEERAAAALSDKKNWPNPLTFDGPVELRVRVSNPEQLDQYHHRQGVEVLDSRYVVSRAPNAWQAWNQFW